MDYTKIVVIVHSRRSDALLSLNGTLVTKLKGLIGFKNSLITTKSRICRKTHFLMKLICCVEKCTKTCQKVKWYTFKHKIRRHPLKEVLRVMCEAWHMHLKTLQIIIFTNSSPFIVFTVFVWRKMNLDKFEIWCGVVQADGKTTIEVTGCDAAYVSFWICCT